MTYKDIEKFVRENEILAREIAIFNCGRLCCSECVFNIHIPETSCLSDTIEAMLNAKYSHESEDDNAKEACNNQHS